MDSIRALWAERGADEGSYKVSLATLDAASLPPGEVLVDVAYSSLNYKDALAVTGRGKILRRFPLVPGIDLAGTVREAQAGPFRPGDRVLAVGQGLGELRSGGFATAARLPADALLPVPAPFTLEQAMAIGTAGFTAMLGIHELERYGVRPGGRPVVVTGAGGGVGSFGVLLLARLGFEVAASTGRPALHESLRRLGARQILDRAALMGAPPPLGAERWAGALDSVGGETLANLLAGTQAYGAVAACGLAGGAQLHTSVFPFILRNVALLGICTAETPRPLRLAIWERLAALVPPDQLAALYRVEPLSAVPALSEELLAGQVHGRIVVDVHR